MLLDGGGSKEAAATVGEWGRDDERASRGAPLSSGVQQQV